MYVCEHLPGATLSPIFIPLATGGEVIKFYKVRGQGRLGEACAILNVLLVISKIDPTSANVISIRLFLLFITVLLLGLLLFVKNKMKLTTFIVV